MSTQKEIEELRERLALLEQIEDMKRRIKQLETPIVYPSIPYCTRNCSCCCNTNCWKCTPYYPMPYITWGSSTTLTTTTPDLNKTSSNIRF